MPELPEVETIRQDLSKLIVGKTITDITTSAPKMVQPSLDEVKKVVVGKKIAGVERRAKILIFRFRPRDSKFLLIHLKLTGQLIYRASKRFTSQESPLSGATLRGGGRYTRVIIKFSDDSCLYFNDLRKFGWMRLVGSEEWGVESQKLGPEPFDKKFTDKYLKEVFGKTVRPIKVVLLDQKKIAGIGNIYANDALFLARIDPRRPAKSLTEKEIKKLRTSILKALKAGIKYRGASDQYYLDALGRKGAYQEHFLTYQRDGKKCFNCEEKMRRIKLAGRGTFYCPACQV